MCFDFVPQHHNIIRYRRGVAVIKDDFHTVCSWVQFKNKEAWKYDLYLGKTSFTKIDGLCGKYGVSLFLENFCYCNMLSCHISIKICGMKAVLCFCGLCACL